ncbi:MAG TPA: SAM-dependent chlorinase/fluorinase [Bacteroidales bacterium]
MAIITLTTDWKSDDYYTATVKGCILSHCESANIVDINLRVNPFNVAQAAFVLQNSFRHFPVGTIHILDVNSESSERMPYIAIKFDGHYFVGTDNGGFGLIFSHDIEVAVRIEKFKQQSYQTFPALNVFAPAAAFLANGNNINNLGVKLETINRQTPILPTIGDSFIAGSVVYIDSYQNVITNISQDLFEQVGKGRRFEILVQSNHYKIARINKTYNETSSGELLAVFNSTGLLEIAINKGNLAELLNLGINSNIRVKFLGEG